MLLLLMVAGFAGWFAYDGWIGYPAENFREHLEQLPAAERQAAAGARVYPSVREGEDVMFAVNKALEEIGVAAQRGALAKYFGGPPSYETNDAWYYFGPAFRIRIGLDDGRPNGRRQPSRSAHHATSIRWQKGLALGLGLVSIYLIAFVTRVRKTHLVLDEGGLSYLGKGPIAWDEMKSLDIRRFNDKGWVDLAYEQNGSCGVIRLDEYHLAAFDEIIDAICSRKHFENPLPVPEQKSAGPA